MAPRHISQNVWDILICPSCGHPLKPTPTGARCQKDGGEYAYTASGSLDLRLQKPRKYQLEFELQRSAPEPGSIKFGLLEQNPYAELDYTGFQVPHHLSLDLLSHFPKAPAQGGMVLDLGCGDEIHRQVCDHTGYEYVGIDYTHPKAMMLGDAHALPFQDHSFDFVLCIAVFEHLRYPFVAIQEVQRVLKPGGRLIGTVAFLEPFHDNSMYHHSHLGVLNMLQFAGFQVEQIAPPKDWSVLVAQASNSLFPGMPRFLSHSIVFPVQVLHQLWWRLGGVVKKKASEQNRLLFTAGSFVYLAWKPK